MRVLVQSPFLADARVERVVIDGEVWTTDATSLLGPRISVPSSPSTGTVPVPAQEQLPRVVAMIRPTPFFAYSDPAGELVLEGLTVLRKTEARVDRAGGS